MPDIFVAQTPQDFAERLVREYVVWHRDRYRNEAWCVSRPGICSTPPLRFWASVLVRLTLLFPSTSWPLWSPGTTARCGNLMVGRSDISGQW
jgi:hypothetical protein